LCPASARPTFEDLAPRPEKAVANTAKMVSAKAAQRRVLLGVGRISPVSTLLGFWLCQAPNDPRPSPWKLPYSPCDLHQCDARPRLVARMWRVGVSRSAKTRQGQAPRRSARRRSTRHCAQPPHGQNPRTCRRGQGDPPYVVVPHTQFKGSNFDSHSKLKGQSRGTTWPGLIPALACSPAPR